MNTPNEPELLAVIQADREAVTAFLVETTGMARSMATKADDHALTQAFARHRLGTRPTPAAVGDVELPSIFDLLEGIAERLRGADDGQRAALQAGFARGTGGVDLPYLIDKIASALAPQPSAVGDVDGLRAALEQTAWLVEENAGGFTHWAALAREAWPRYKARRGRRLGELLELDQYLSPIKRVKDANDALRFARKEDAEAFIALFDRFLLNAHATEHLWPIAALATRPAAIEPVDVDERARELLAKALDAAGMPASAKFVREADQGSFSPLIAASIDAITATLDQGGGR